MSSLAHKTIALILLVATIGLAFSPLLMVPPRAFAVQTGSAIRGGAQPDAVTGASNSGAGSAAGSAAGTAAKGAGPVAAACAQNVASVTSGTAAATTESQAISNTIGVLVALPPFISGVIGGQSQANIANNQKQNCLNAIAWFLAKVLIDQIVQSTVNWINNGFHGSPTFVQDPAGFLGNVADEAFGSLLTQLFPDAASVLCSPIALDLQIHLLLKFQYYGKPQQQVACRISDIIDNVTNIPKNSGQSLNQFLNGDFNEGGWNRWLEVTQVPSNNKYGGQIILDDMVQTRIDAAQQTESTKLNWGNGFHSITDAANQIITPGKTIEGALSNVTGTDLRQLELADEFNEVVGALIGQLMKTAFSGGGGIAGLSSGNSSSAVNGQAFTAALSDPSANAYSASTSDPSIVTYTGPDLSIGPSRDTYDIAYNKPTLASNYVYDGVNTTSNPPSYGTNSSGAGSCTTPATAIGSYGFWQVDLGAGNKQITSVTLVPSVDQAPQNFTVLVSDTPFPTVTAIGYFRPINSLPTYADVIPAGKSVTFGPYTQYAYGWLPTTSPQTLTGIAGIYSATIAGPVVATTTIPVTAFSVNGAPVAPGTTSILGQYVRIQSNLKDGWVDVGNNNVQMVHQKNSFCQVTVTGQ